MSQMICIHNAMVLNGFTQMKNCAVLIKQNKIIDVFNEKRFKEKKFPDDAIIIDTSSLNLEQVVQTVLEKISHYGA